MILGRIGYYKVSWFSSSEVRNHQKDLKQKVTFSDITEKATLAVVLQIDSRQEWKKETS